MSNLKDSGQQGLGSLMYCSFIIKKKYRVDETAEKMGIKPDTLYRYIRSENIMPADRVIDLVKATGDIEFLEFFCEPCGYMPVRQVNGKLFDTSIEKDEITLSIRLGRLFEEIQKAYATNGLDRREQQSIHKAIFRFQQKLAEMDEKIKAEAK